MSVIRTIELIPHERFELQQHRSTSAWPHLYRLLDQVNDPEIPVISIWEMGILQNVVLGTTESNQTQVTVTITPTYSGCPAMQQISEDVKTTLANAGYPNVIVKQQLSPPWTTDWMTPRTKKQLRSYGIAPPEDQSCPQCGSKDITTISEFGSTACKAQLRCNTCLEPFDHFKAI
ncbi:MAG: 1,2-phenylacetyl-CoA epoxidase subunit PaaD [Pseudomonadota bacterium]